MVYHDWEHSVASTRVSPPATTSDYFTLSTNHTRIMTPLVFDPLRTRADGFQSALNAVTRTQPQRARLGGDQLVLRTGHTASTARRLPDSWIHAAPCRLLVTAPVSPNCSGGQF